MPIRNTDKLGCNNHSYKEFSAVNEQNKAQYFDQNGS
jgi:hypothetical protein